MHQEILTKKISFQLAARFDANVGCTVAQKPTASRGPNAVTTSYSVKISISESTYALAAIIVMLSAGKPRKRPFGKIQNIYLATPSEQHVRCILMSDSLWLWKIHYQRKTSRAYYSESTTCLSCSVQEKPTARKIMSPMAWQQWCGRLLFFFCPQNKK